MKKIFRLLIIFTLIAALLYTPSAIAAPGTGKSPKKPNERFNPLSPEAAVAAMTPGWNLGNTLDAIPTEGSWNNPPVEEHTFDDIKDSGFKSVRIPVTWDSHMELLLNGNQLTGITHGSTPLQEGTDYTYHEASATVTLKADFVAGLMEESNLGTNAQLTFAFSEGAQQVMDVVQYDHPTPAVQTIVIDKDGEVDENLRIPLAFNGTKLRTIKAVVDSTGRPVLEEKWNWTPYTNYGDDFYLEDGHLHLTRGFLEYVKEDATLTLEFYPEGIETEVKLRVE